MNRKQKIIVSITGIFIVLLALVGLTYAYFLTRITGNSNDKSISVTTAKLELVYGDNSAEIIKGTGALMPTVETDADDAIGTKTFTVTNNGEDSSYVVIIDNIETKYVSNGSYKDENGNTITYTKDQETDFVTNDFRYTLACVVKDKSGNAISNETCNDVETLSVFPIKGGILVGNGIEENRVHEYTLTLWYIENGQNQSIDMNKIYQARVNISDVNQMENPFMTGVTETDNASLAYNIIKNAKQNKNGTRFVNISPTKVAEEISTDNWDLGIEENVYYNDEYVVGYAESEDILWSCYDEGENCDAVTDYESCTSEVEKNYVFDENMWDTVYVDRCENGKIVTGTAKYEKVLSTTQDNYGTSYYFRGMPDDNYVTFSNKCWRIVRIQGDGSIKLTLESQSVCSETMTSNFSIGRADWGYKVENGKYIGDYKNSTSGMKNLLTTWFDTNFKSNGNLTNAGLKIKDEEWCLGNITNTYAISSPYGELGTTALENYASGTSFYYEIGRNLYGYGVTPNATLKCNGETETSKIGALTADEVAFAGGNPRTSNYDYYLQNDTYNWWTLSRAAFDIGYDSAFFVDYDGYLSYEFVNDFVGVNGDYPAVRPSVTLVTNTKITKGEGTKGNPYIINEG